MKAQLAKGVAFLILIALAVVVGIAISVTVATVAFYMAFTAYDYYLAGEYFWSSVSAGISLLAFLGSIYGGLGMYNRKVLVVSKGD